MSLNNEDNEFSLTYRLQNGIRDPTSCYLINANITNDFEKCSAEVTNYCTVNDCFILLFSFRKVLIRNCFYLSTPFFLFLQLSHPPSPFIYPLSLSIFKDLKLLNIYIYFYENILIHILSIQDEVFLDIINKYTTDQFCLPTY